MGVSGCGKSTVAELLAKKIGWRFLEADNFHSEANRQKMSAGLALSDEDRWPWLDQLASKLAQDSRTVLACSALRSVYRARLQAHVPIDFVLLSGSHELIAERLQKRSGHFMNPQLLGSQFECLEPPSNGLILEITASAQQISEQIFERLKLHDIKD